ncbi:TonB-dependent receptor [Sphingobacterium haloxyli]|uniref:SusC/RagA family TonB-linked outer membrane protein n=1 Tax=Sphingobacterium haloxyli TaxID=2100533 RepID=A0A2S9J2D4_9SPHI|nr:TonB-dependent receptor [Sphingobacterium haloxyli]PRD46943.1 SusC/RagA family TonB-linked outer membrane protein [Sphingobacterium haloxyli]
MNYHQILRVMKIIMVLLTCGLLQLSAATYGQRITIHKKNVNIDKVLFDIRQQSGYDFFFDADIFAKNTKVSVSIRDADIVQALDACLKNTSFRYTIDNNIVVIKPDPKKAQNGTQPDVIVDQQRTRRITGRITDSQGQPLAGATITAIGKVAMKTSSLEDGSYVIEVDAETRKLAFSLVGYTASEIVLGSSNQINVSLETHVNEIEEVVMVGYGTQRKSDLSGSVGSVKGEQLMERPAVNLEQSLAGRIAGVNVSTNSGRPGGRTRIRVRGFSSINAANDPLYVVDGVIFTAGISSINPNDIESIDVLKDASATAIYGTRGTNGVIIVTTKRGKAGGQLNYDNYISVNNLARKQDVLNSQEFMMIEDQAYLNAEKFDPIGFGSGRYMDPKEKRKSFLVGNDEGKAELFYEDDAGNIRPLYDVDWQDKVTRSAVSHNHNVSWTGTDEKSNYGIYLGHVNENGIIINSYLRRYNARAVLDREVKDWLKVGGMISYSNNTERRADESQGGNNVPRMMIEMVPFIPYRYPDGTYGKRLDYDGLEKGDNPRAQLDESKRIHHTNTFNGNANATVTLAEGLDFNSAIGANVVNQYSPYFNSTESDLSAGLGRNYAQIASHASQFWQWTNRLNYSVNFNNDHQLDAMAGVEYQKFKYMSWSAAAQDIPDDYYEWYNLGSAATLQPAASASRRWQMGSFFGRANYSFKNRYLLTFTGRYDGSSRFGADNKYAFFPSGAFAWRISDEDFMQSVEKISALKLRVSYGLTGNSEIGEYRSQANLATNSYLFGGSLATGTLISTLANPELKWEKTSQFNVGLDAGFWNSRLNVEADFYIKNTNDLLLAAPVPTSSGYSSLTQNIGSLRNTGAELSVNSVNIAKDNFTWRTNFNISWLKNEITALGTNNEDIFMGPNFLGNTNILRVGESVSSFYGYVNDGVWSAAEATEAARYGKKPGDIKYVDLNGDGQINDRDRQIIGKGVPDFYGTLSNSFRYKNVELLVELQYSKGNDVFRLSEHSSLDRTGIANSFADVLDGWTPDNQQTEIAQWRPTGAGYDSRLESRKVQDGSFIRGKNLSLSYSLPTAKAKQIGFNGIRVFASAQNFFLLTKYKGYDPEVVTFDDTFAQGILFHDYPKAHTFMLGLNLSL